MEYIRIKDLKPLHFPGVSRRRPSLERLSDKQLLASVHHPRNRDYLRIDGDSGRIVDGNGRAYELQRRAALPDAIITEDTLIPYMPYKRDRSEFWDM